MTTQIVKLNSNKDDVDGFFGNIAKKIGVRRDYQVTVIMKKPVSQFDDDSRDYTQLDDKQIMQIMSKKGTQRNNTGQSLSKRGSGSKRSSQLIVQRSTKFLLPNIKISQTQVPQQLLPKSKRNISIKNQRTSILNIDHQSQKIQSSKKQFRKKSKEQYQSNSGSVSVSIQTSQSLLPRISKSTNSNEAKIVQVDEQSSSLLSKEPMQQHEDLVKMQDFLHGNYGTTFLKSEREDSQVNQQQNQDDDQSNAQSMFILQNKLNDALKFIEQDQLYQLQDFLYEFKDRHNYLTDRIQIKWRLLMAYCKENRKQYQRAAINYNQVIQISKESPKAISIDFADIYHRLGICYSQIKQWNNGITYFGKALNQYKRNKNIFKYAECINNLGTLYLHSGHVSEAEQCFLSSFYIKQQQYGKDSIKLFSTLLNLFECNLLSKNYEQAEKMILILERVVNKMRDNQILLGSIYRRKGKLSFLSGQLKEAQKNFSKANQILRQKFPYCLQFGQLMSCMAILKLEQHKYHQSKQLFDKALILINFYCSKQSSAVKSIKKNIDLVNGYIKIVDLKNNNQLSV